MQEQSLEQVLSKIDKKISGINPINVDDVPTVPLYMDQLTTFMDSKLRDTLRNPSEDKVLTKTMINNYAKMTLSPRRSKSVIQKIISMSFCLFFTSKILCL